jgi:hypothetical protein
VILRTEYLAPLERKGSLRYSFYKHFAPPGLRPDQLTILIFFANFRNSILASVL